jgi:predicted TIM-barrel fold metal-dependent hydrolase
MNVSATIERDSARDTKSIARLKPVSADSHIVEPPHCYIDYIDPKFRDVAPRIVHEEKGDRYVIDGMVEQVPLNMAAVAGEDPAGFGRKGVIFSDLNPGAWKAKERIPAQERDGVAAEVIYPTVGMLLCNHPDYDYKNACFNAYNRWLADFVSGAPGRVFGLGQTAARNPAEMVEDLRRIKDAGFIGAMLPGIPAEEDYDSAIYDPVWEAAVGLKLPISFHILTSSRPNSAAIVRDDTRGPKINSFNAFIRGNQDLIGLFIFSGVFDRFPDLKIISAEGDAGWGPHYAYRADHAYKIHRVYMNNITLQRKPSEYFTENVYMTFQDDFTAFEMADHVDRRYMNHKRLLWASDFPHSDSTWPRSMETLVEHTTKVSPESLEDIVHNNVVELYGLEGRLAA